MNYYLTHGLHVAVPGSGIKRWRASRSILIVAQRRY